MVNKVYTTALIITIGIVILLLFTYDLLNQPREVKDTDKLIKIKGTIIVIPSHVLDAILVKYKNLMIKYSKSEVDINILVLENIKQNLASHISAKYGIKFSLNPMELEKYIMNQGIPMSNDYDEDLVGGIDMTDTGKNLGIIIWYLEKLIWINKKNSNIEIPLSLEDIDKLSQENPTILVPIAENSDFKYLPMDLPEHIRLPTKSTPQKCSSLRNNLDNFLSYSPNEFDSEQYNEKNKNKQEALSSWNNRPQRNTIISHPSEDEYKPNENIKLNPYISYAGYDLSFSLNKEDNIRLNQKQELTDLWDHLENKFLE
jgi:hypothetical protein